MWPVQTLTLLLCLTDEEQLFAQRAPQEPIPVVIGMDHDQTTKHFTGEDLLWDPTC